MRTPLLLAFNLVANFSLLPLQLVSSMRLVAALAGSPIGRCDRFQYCHAGITLPRVALTIVAVLVLGGGRVIALCIIRDYLDRVPLNANKKPQFAICNVVRSEPPGPVAAVDRAVPAHPHARGRG